MPQRRLFASILPPKVWLAISVICGLSGMALISLAGIAFLSR